MSGVSPSHSLTSTRGGLLGLLVTMVAIAVAELIHRFILAEPAVSSLILLATVMTALIGGARFGLASCGMFIAATVWSLWPEGGSRNLPAAAVVQLACTIIVPPTIVVMIGALQRRAERALQDQARMQAAQVLSDRKFAESEDSRAEQRHIFNSVPAMIWYKDPQGQILRANELAARSIGLKVNDVVGRSTYELYPSEAEKYQRDDAEVIQSGRAKLGIIERYETRDGKDQWVRTDKIPLKDNEGKTVGVIVFAVDITDQKAEQDALQRALSLLDSKIRQRSEDLKRLEEKLAREKAQRQEVEVALQHGEERFRTIINNTAAVVYMKDLEGRYVLANKRFEEIFELEPGVVIGKLDRDLFPEHIVQQLNANDRDVMQARRAIQFEEWVPHHGAMHAYISLKFPMYDVRGQISGICGISTDITDRKKAEEETAARLRFEESVAAVSRSLLARATADESLHEALRHLLHPSCASRVYLFENVEDSELGLCMRQTHEICAEGVRPEINNPLLQRLPYAHGLSRWRDELSQGRPVQGLVETFPPEERAILEPQQILSILVLPIGSAGQWYGFIGFDETRTRRVWTEADIRLLRTAAEMIGAYLARERSEGELRKAKEVAEAASQAKTRLLANVSHEIRNPLMAMMSWAERVRKTQHAHMHGEVILRNGRHLLQLVNELLDLSRVEAGKLTVGLDRHSLIDILHNVAAQASPPPDMDRSVEFDIRYLTPVPLTIQTDAIRLTQAVVNLVNNALKFTERGHVHVLVSVDQKGPEPRLAIAVEDTGKGIPADQLEYIFEAFAQVGAQTGRLFEGVGLGLPIARWIAEQLGGSLTVQSTRGKGSTFTMHIATGPLEDVEWIPPEDIPVFGETTWSPADTMPRLRGRVLLAEDAVDVRKAIQDALTDAGAFVHAVGDGQQAVEVFKSSQEPFDLIVLDIWMPGMDGKAAVAEIRRHGYRNAVIALTAIDTSCGEEERNDILDAGFDEVWGKPMELDELVRKAGEFLASGGAEDSRAASPCRFERSFVAGRAKFLELLPERMANLRAALQQENIQEATILVHTLHGAAGSFGHMPISVQAAKMEDMLTKGPGLAAAQAELSALEKLASEALSGTGESA